jgi:hypothetical protein
LKFIWTCPAPLNDFCSAVKDNTLIIENKDFKGTYNLTYTIKLRIEWNNRVNDVDNIEFYDFSSQVRWLNFSVPDFTLEGPSQVKMSSELTRFQILLKNL